MNELPKKASLIDDATADALRIRLSISPSTMSITTRLEFEQCAILSTGLISTSTDHLFYKNIRTPLFIKIDRSLNATLGLTFPVGLTFTAFFYDIDCNLISSASGTGASVSIPLTTCYFKLMFVNTNGTDLIANKDISVTYVSPTNGPEFLKNKRISSNEHSFVYRTSYQQGGKSILVNGDASPTQVPTTLHANSGILKLPLNYSQNGTPVRLIIFNHGSGAYSAFSVKTFSALYISYVDYLVAEGYAIFDCYGKTDIHSTGENFGSPTSMMAIVNGYKWVIKNYNIADDGCFTFGKSQGGLPTALLCYNSGIPLRAAGLLAPLLDPIMMLWAYSVPERYTNMSDFGFTVDTNLVMDTLTPATPWSVNLMAYLTENLHKFTESSALWIGNVDVTPEEMLAWYENKPAGFWETKKKVCNVPTKIWIGYDDGLNDGAYFKYYSMLKNGNSKVALRYIASGWGGHHAVDTTGPMITVDTKYGGTLSNIPVAYAEMLAYFKQFDNV